MSIKGRFPAGAFLVLLLLFFAAPVMAAEIVVLYSTDVHGRIFTDEKTVGLDLVAALHKKIPGSILVDSGDFLQGGTAANLTQGRDVVELMKAAGYFAASIGNHEFDFGRDVLAERIKEAEAGPAPMWLLSANISEHGRPLYRGSAALEAQGVKVGFFGLTTPSTPQSSNPRGLKDIEFSAPLEAAKREIAALKAEGCELIVALGHIGSQGATGLSSAEIAAEAPGLDVFLDGHSHVTLDHQPESGPAVFSAGVYGQYIGRLDIDYDTDAHRVVSIKNALLDRAALEREGLAPDPEVKKALDQLNLEIDLGLAGIMAESPLASPFDHVAMRKSETLLGDICADAMRAKSGADVAVINGGSFRAGLPKGPVSRRALLEMLPFESKVLTFEASGRELRDLMEHGLAELPESSGRFPQISGLTLTIKPTAPVGSRVMRMVLADGRELRDDETLTLSLNDFMAEGGDGYQVFIGRPEIFNRLELIPVLAEYLGRIKADDYGPKAPPRIVP